MPVHVDVVIQPRAAALPFGAGIRVHGQRQQRQQRRTLDRLEQRPAARAQVAHRPVVQVGNQLADGAIQLGQRKEPAMPQPGENPTLHHLDGNLDPSGSPLAIPPFGTDRFAMALSRGRRTRAGSTAVP